MDFENTNTTKPNTLVLEELLRRWREENDLAARDQLFTDSQARIRAVVKKQLRLKFLDLKTDGGILTDDAQSIVNSAILKRMATDQLRPATAIRGYFAYVRKVTFHLLADLRDHFNVPGRTLHGYEDGTGGTVPDREDRAAEFRHLWELVATLPPEFREALELKHWLGLSHEDIRHVLDLPNIVAVTRLLERAKEQLGKISGLSGVAR